MTNGPAATHRLRISTIAERYLSRSMGSFSRARCGADPARVVALKWVTVKGGSVTHRWARSIFLDVWSSRPVWIELADRFLLFVFSSRRVFAY
jgi:hypothetical protein